MTFVRLTSNGGDPYVAIVKLGSYLELPPYMAFAYRTNCDLDAHVFIGSGSGFIVRGLNPNSIGQAFGRLAHRLGYDIHLHQLRHYYASVGAILGVPDIYLADMGGWKHDSGVMKSVYQNKIKSMSDYYADKMNDHIDGIMQKKGEAK